MGCSVPAGPAARRGPARQWFELLALAHVTMPRRDAFNSMDLSSTFTRWRAAPAVWGSLSCTSTMPSGDFIARWQWRGPKRRMRCSRCFNNRSRRAARPCLPSSSTENACAAPAVVSSASLNSVFAQQLAKHGLGYAEHRGAAMGVRVVGVGARQHLGLPTQMPGSTVAKVTSCLPGRAPKADGLLAQGKPMLWSSPCSTMRSPCA